MGGKISEMEATEDMNREVRFYRGDQWFFNIQWHLLSKEGKLKANTLETCRYPNGQWYEGGRGGNGIKVRADCSQSQNPLVVIQNNWMVGNERKVLRAKRWDHWYLQDDKVACQIPEDVALQRAVKSAEDGIPPHGAPTVDEME